MRRLVFEAGGTHVGATVEGAGPPIVLLPSLARDSNDFEPLVAALVAHGFQVVRPDPRGIGDSRGPAGEVTLRDLAADVAATIERIGEGRAIVLGHAFGNWVARNVATHFPQLTRGVVLAAAAARAQPDIARRAVEIASDLARSDEERLAALEVGFFAPGRDARIWLGGWHPAARAVQRQATTASPREIWWGAGTAPVLDLIAALDPFRPRETWQENRAELGQRVTVEVIPDASHALICEQPVAVAEAIADWADGGRV